MKKMMKKYNLFTAIVICFLVYIILSWFVPTGTVTSGAYAAASTNPIGLFGLVYYPGITIGTFAQFGLIILAIGAFYGVMAKTGVYGKLVGNVANKFKGKEKTFLILIIAILTILSSVTGLPYAILVIVPFIMAILLKLGYNKITTVASTVGSILVGGIGSTFGYTIAGIAASILSLKITQGIWSRLALLVIVLFLFILFIIGNKQSKISETKKANISKKGKKEEIEAVDAEEILFLENETPSSKNTLALEIVAIITLLLAFVSMFNWNTIFKITLFEDFYEKIIAIKIASYPLLQNLLGLTNPFGYWDSYELVALLVASSVIMGWVYGLSLVDLCEGMMTGAKRVLKTACLITVANIIFTLTLSSTDGTMLVFITEKLAGLSSSFNLFTTALSGMIGAFFYNNFYYFFNAISTDLAIHIDSDYYTIMTFVLQSVYGLMMMVLPTSLVLISGLGLAGVSFKEWIKYIWRFVLQLIVIVIIISVILVLVV